ncbi:peptide-methionine (R)-S-oxide reductase [Patescibacteria group bacterium]|nr:MAG: peptide-methionine (R)-S-oxide reductase [Patescibacteria group bacterium]
MPESKKWEKSAEEWKKELGADTYRITREGGTEAPFSGAYWDSHEKGMFLCSNCGAELFSSDTKFDSGTGWPSFDRPADREAVELREDRSGGMVRTEVLCKRCGAHLGHVFEDGPTETCKRFCINSAALKLEKKT